jgi:hypothetical protein
MFQERPNHRPGVLALSALVLTIPLAACSEARSQSSSVTAITYAPAFSVGELAVPTDD